jgi:N-acetylglucosaminyl-diphospho-decaprenol L-rhamnosyltransferase
MTVFVIIPVFNRVEHTCEIVHCLRKQTGVDLRIVIIDDGSTDGTEEFLAKQADITVIKGNGNLWWAGAIHKALRALHPGMKPGDFFAFMNNDTKIDDSFLSTLVTASQAHERAVVGSIVRSGQAPHALLDIGPRADLWTMAIWDIARDVSDDERMSPKTYYTVDFLPGRGTLFPSEVLDHTGYMRPWLLPHYHADYEFADRARRAGFPLIVASNAVTYSTAEFGNQKKAASFWHRYFGKGSPENIAQKVAFFSMVGSPGQRLTAIPRMFAAELERRAHYTARGISRIVKRIVYLLLGREFVEAALHSIRHRLRVLRQLRHSSVARARLLAFLERRCLRRPDALQVYTSATCLELQNGKVSVFGPTATRHVRFFKRLRVRTEEFRDNASSANANANAADLVFLSWEMNDEISSLPTAEALARRIRPGGVIYCAYSEPSGSLDPMRRLMAELAQMSSIEIIAESHACGPAEGRSDGRADRFSPETGRFRGGVRTPGFLAARRVH